MSIIRVEYEVLLDPVKYFEVSLLQSNENKQFCQGYVSIAKNTGNTILFTEFR